MLVILHPIGEVRTNLIIIKKRRPLRTPVQVCYNLQSRMLKPTHDGAHFNVIEFALISLSR